MNGFFVAQLSPARISVDPVTITLVGGMIVTIIGSIVTGVVTIITAMRVSSAMVKQAETATKVDALGKDTEAIKGHVNSEKTAAEGREAALRQRIELLQEIIADKKATAGLLAQAVAQALPSSSVVAQINGLTDPTRTEVVNPSTSPVPVKTTDDPR